MSRDPRRRPSWFPAYAAVISARYRALLQYRTAALAGFATQLFWGGIRLMVFAAFYGVTNTEQPMSLAQVVTYVWLGQALLGLLPWNVDGEIAGLIRDGGVAFELVRPLDLYGYWFCRSIALRTATTTLRCLPMLVFAMLVLPLLGLEAWAMSAPADALAGAAFVVSLALAVLLAAAMTMLMHVLLLASLSGDGFNRIMPAVVNLFGGLVIPLPLFPDVLQPVVLLLPFGGLMDFPFRIYCGQLRGTGVAEVILLQCGWTLALVLLGRGLLQRSLARLVVQGG